MKNKEIKEMAGDLKENLRLCGGVKLLDHNVEAIAYELSKKYQPKIPEDSVVLPREEYERLKRVEAEKDRLYEIKLDLENQLIEKGWTDYEGADEIEKRVSKETAEKYQAKIDELEEEIDMLIKKQKEDRSYEIEQKCKETARKIIVFIETLKVKEDDRHQWREDHNDCIDKVILKLNQKFINNIEIKE